MNTIIPNWLNRKNKKFTFCLISFLFSLAAISIYSLLQPTTTTIQTNENNLQINSAYDYKATIIPNILYPKGGTVVAGDTLFKKVTTAIPFSLQSTINSENSVVAKGSHEVQLVVKAGELWQREFPLEEKQNFEYEGTELSAIDNTYKIDLEKVKDFITQVEEEIGIRSDQYLLEVVPNIQGTITHDEIENDILVEDKLVFEFSYDGIKLASEKTFLTTVPFTTTKINENMFHFWGTELPLKVVRITSTLLSILLLAAIIYVYKDVVINRNTPPISQAEKINKKHGSRIIAVSQKVNMAQKSIFTLDSFNSLIIIADEKELPIFCHKDHYGGCTVYFIVDGDYLYSYETSIANSARSTKKSIRGEKAYAKG